MLLWQRTKTAVQSVSDPIKANREVDVLAILFWLCYGGWGLFTIVQNASVFSRAGTPDFYQTVWGGLIGLFSFAAAASAVFSFYTPHTRYDRRIAAKRTERFALFSMVGLIGLYPVFLLMYGGETGPRPDLFCLATSYCLFPIWRIRHLKTRINDLYSVAEMFEQEQQAKDGR